MQHEQKPMTQTQEDSTNRVFTHIDRIKHEIRQITFSSAIFIWTSSLTKYNELEYANSAKTHYFFSRNWPKTMILAIFGAQNPNYA